MVLGKSGFRIMVQVYKNQKSATGGASRGIEVFIMCSNVTPFHFSHKFITLFIKTNAGALV